MSRHSPILTVKIWKNIIKVGRGKVSVRIDRNVQGELYVRADHGGVPWEELSNELLKLFLSTSDAIDQL